MEKILNFNDSENWKAKHIKDDDERIEIGKTIHGTQILIKVYKRMRYIDEYQYSTKNHNTIRILANSKIDMTLEEYHEMNLAINEALEILNIKKL